MPRTSWVLPAPKSPVNAMTKPDRAARPQVSPSCSVSAGLCEVNVAMASEGADAVRVPQPQPGLLCHPADAAEFEGREPGFPGIEQPDGGAAGGGEEQLEILAVGEGGQQGGFGGGRGA